MHLHSVAFIEYSLAKSLHILTALCNPTHKETVIVKHQHNQLHQRLLFQPMSWSFNGCKSSSKYTLNKIGESASSYRTQFCTENCKESTPFTHAINLKKIPGILRFINNSNTFTKKFKHAHINMAVISTRITCTSFSIADCGICCLKRGLQAIS